MFPAPPCLQARAAAGRRNKLIVRRAVRLTQIGISRPDHSAKLQDRQRLLSGKGRSPAFLQTIESSALRSGISAVSSTGSSRLTSRSSSCWTPVRKKRIRSSICRRLATSGPLPFILTSRQRRSGAPLPSASQCGIRKSCEREAKRWPGISARTRRGAQRSQIRHLTRPPRKARRRAARIPTSRTSRRVCRVRSGTGEFATAFLCEASRLTAVFAPLEMT